MTELALNPGIFVFMDPLSGATALIIFCCRSSSPPSTFHFPSSLQCCLTYSQGSKCHGGEKRSGKGLVFWWGWGGVGSSTPSNTPLSRPLHVDATRPPSRRPLRPCRERGLLLVWSRRRARMIEDIAASRGCHMASPDIWSKVIGGSQRPAFAGQCLVGFFFLRAQLTPGGAKHQHLL